MRNLTWEKGLRQYSIFENLQFVGYLKAGLFSKQQFAMFDGKEFLLGKKSVFKKHSAIFDAQTGRILGNMYGNVLMTSGKIYNWKKEGIFSNKLAIFATKQMQIELVASFLRGKAIIMPVGVDEDLLFLSGFSIFRLNLAIILHFLVLFCLLFIVLI